jgi:diguanylate cyclase (GGDEF)-like protein
MYSRFFIIVAEVVFITFLDYKMAAHYYSLDVLYCLPVIQVARFNAFQSLRRSDSQILTVIAVLCALAWSSAEAAITWPNFPVSAFLMNVITRAVTFTIIGRVVAKMWKDKEYSQKDPLTGLANRTEFLKKFEEKQTKSARVHEPYSLLFINIDHFRVFNDTQGYLVGDEALKVLANTLRENSRSVDLVARLGSDEFAVLFPGTDKQTCELLGSRIFRAAERKFSQRSWGIALSFGHVTEIGKGRSVDELLHAADAHMKMNKQSKE